MRFLFLIIPFIFMQNCSKPKTVLVCGDHICINKSEANQYFKENLSIEVKIIDSKKNIKLDIVELNLNESISKKDKTKKEIKTLTNEQIENIKKKLKKNKKNNKIAKKNTYNKKNKSKKITRKNVRQTSLNEDKIKLNNNTKEQLKVADVCSIIEKCNIDEISKFLLNQAKKKNFLI